MVCCRSLLTDGRRMLRGQDTVTSTVREVRGIAVTQPSSECQRIVTATGCQRECNQRPLPPRLRSSLVVSFHQGGRHCGKVAEQSACSVWSGGKIDFTGRCARRIAVAKSNVADAQASKAGNHQRIARIVLDQSVELTGGKIARRDETGTLRITAHTFSACRQLGSSLLCSRFKPIAYALAEGWTSALPCSHQLNLRLLHTCRLLGTRPTQI